MFDYLKDTQIRELAFCKVGKINRIPCRRSNIYFKLKIGPARTLIREFADKSYLDENFKLRFSKKCLHSVH